MSNQVLLWGTFIVPWLTLFFMKKEEIKRYMPTALITLAVLQIVLQVGISTGLWVIRETTFPLVMIPTYTYGVFPVLTMWLFKFTYGHFWIFEAVEVVVNLGYVLILMPWLDSRGIIVFNAPVISFFIATGLGILFYVYQMWQEDTLASAEGYRFSMEPELAAARKPLSKDKDDKDKQ